MRVSLCTLLSLLLGACTLAVSRPPEHNTTYVTPPAQVVAPPTYSSPPAYSSNTSVCADGAAPPC